MEMDNNLLTEMVERWRKETHTFHLLEGEMTITLSDVAMLTELPIDGDAIIESSQKSLNGWGPFISERLGINIPEKAPEGRRVPPLHKSMLLIPWLVRTAGELPEDATDAQIERYARIYLIVWLKDFCFRTSLVEICIVCGFELFWKSGTRLGEKVGDLLVWR
ncbi:unnamed protein product [Linum tenue]|uniref:Aminotransferase-like plant mobile domain-containing protein n=1 Tax=Linum tenue TaxID=586396 RepID=A0AAV0PUX3_9ROSI|nr:unnamed protein product [Linum tenue]